MKLDLAIKMALELMKKHRVGSWNLMIDHDKNFAGYTIHKAKEIGLSQVFLKMNTPKEVKDTVLHEIAHALCPEGEDHGPLWKETAKKLGARPFYNGTIERDKLKTKIYKKYDTKKTS